MSKNELVAQDHWALMEKVVVHGDISKLSPAERISLYRQVCESVGLNPLTRPFEYLILNGKMVLYARKDATDQLRRLHNVSVRIVVRERHDDVYVVTAQASMPSGRTDESIGAVSIAGLKGDALANAYMKCEAKAKRRVTLSICGLGLLDETEVDSIPGARAVTVVHDGSPVESEVRKIQPAEPVDPEREAARNAWQEARQQALGAGVPKSEIKKWTPAKGCTLADIQECAEELEGLVELARRAKPSDDEIANQASVEMKKEEVAA
ncbi:MAG: hypothetical protein KGL39_52215 [Patescibacteria group bacterium]|nr:hypothetical protein [Patescibacteria group bacterium]